MTGLPKWHKNHPDSTHIGAATGFKRNPTMKRGMPVYEDHPKSGKPTDLGASAGAKTRKRRK